MDLTSYPVIDVKAGGTFAGVLAAVNRIIDITIPRDWQEGGTMVIPVAAASPTRPTSSSIATC